MNADLFHRRGFLGGAVATLLAACKPDEPMVLPTPPGTPPFPDPFEGGEFLESRGFITEGDVEFGPIRNQGWDARQYYDLSQVEADGLVTPTEDFFLRTEYPDLLTTSEADWRVVIDGLVDSSVALTLDDIDALVQPQGDVLIECSGNTYHSRFGLLSSATWSGALLTDVLDAHAQLDPDAIGVVVRGFDDHSIPSNNNHSTPGASWFLTFEQMAECGSFLAVEMNEAPLTPNHGFPVRLVNPRWYGCSNIKWVEQIRVVGADEPATGQMLEFDTRTHQPDPTPSLARDFRAPSQDDAAVPVRIEKWRIDDRIAYRIVGIHWGGSGPVALEIETEDGVEPVTLQHPRDNPNTWSLWVHRFEPQQTGEVEIRMRVADPGVPTVRLDREWYARTFVVDEV